MSDGDTMKKTIEMGKNDWSRLDAMSAKDRTAAAHRDPDAKPLTPDDFARMKRTPQVKIIRRALGLTQEEFATQFHILLGTLRDWEQGVSTAGLVGAGLSHGDRA